MGKEFCSDICMLCKKNYGKSPCCESSPRVPLTIKDVERIKNLGFEEKDFLVAGQYNMKKIKGEEDWWVGSMIYIDGKYLKINTKKEGTNCIFLKDGVGCTLGKDRPFVCKIFPFWMNDRNKIVWEPGEKEVCFMGVNDWPIEKVMVAIGENEASIKEYFKEIKEDCLKNKEEHRKLLLDILKK